MTQPRRVRVRAVATAKFKMSLTNVGTASTVTRAPTDEHTIEFA